MVDMTWKVPIVPRHHNSMKYSNLSPEKQEFSIEAPRGAYTLIYFVNYSFIYFI